MTDAQRPITVVRVRGAARFSGTDYAASEEPLQIRLHDRPFAVIMRTPGADCELAAGFLLAERVIRSAEDLGTVLHCTEDRDGPPEGGHHVLPKDGRSDGPPEGGHHVLPKDGRPDGPPEGGRHVVSRTAEGG